MGLERRGSSSINYCSFSGVPVLPWQEGGKMFPFNNMLSVDKWTEDCSEQLPRGCRANCLKIQRSQSQGDLIMTELFPLGCVVSPLCWLMDDKAIWKVINTELSTVIPASAGLRERTLELFSLGKTQLQGGLPAAFQCPKGLQEMWRGAFCKSL